MERLRSLFSRENLPKFLLLAGVYLLGRMEGEGRFEWSDIFSSAWKAVANVAVSASDSARNMMGF